MLIFAIESTMASWAQMPDERLQSQSQLIVYAQYLGDSVIEIDNKKFNLGILNVSKVLKGQISSAFVFIKTPAPSQGLRSDMIFFKSGQSGLWFLKPVSNLKGIYHISHPSQFQQTTPSGDIVKYWQQRLLNP